MELNVTALTGAAIDPVLDEVARLRITVFAEFPYLYDGDVEYETWYLKKFAALDGAVIVLTRDGDEVVGAATGSPLASQFDEFSAPLREAGFNLDEIFYCGESVLLSQYRGHGLGHQFFDHREAQARKLGLSKSCFLSVIRAEDDPRRPDGYRTLHGFWRKRGYEPVEGLTASFPWKEHGDSEETMNELQYWMRDL